MKKKEIEQILVDHKQYRNVLFRRGYLITTNEKIEVGSYPFYNEIWNKEKIGNYYFFVHKDQDFYSYSYEGINIAMIGHAYNPFNMKYKEEEILQDCVKAYISDEKEFFDKVSELTRYTYNYFNEFFKNYMRTRLCGNQVMLFWKS